MIKASLLSRMLFLTTAAVKHSGEQMVLTQAENKLKAKGIVKRMAKAFGESDMKSICKHLDCHEKVPSNWITKGFVPAKAIMTCHEMTGVSLDYLASGKMAVFELTPELTKTFESQALTLLKDGERLKLITATERNSLTVLARSFTKQMITTFSYKDEGQESQSSSS